jgi:hypothetical protein
MDFYTWDQVRMVLALQCCVLGQCVWQHCRSLYIICGRRMALLRDSMTGDCAVPCST